MKAELTPIDHIKMRTPPSGIEIMLHIYYSPEPYPHDSPSAQDTIIGLLRDGLIKERGQPSEYGGKYCATDRGKAWVEMICATPYPEQVWRNPVTKEACF